MPATVAGGASGVITSGGTSFIHRHGASNKFVGLNAGNFTMTGPGGNTAVGQNALDNNISGVNNAAVGVGALGDNTIGDNNIAIGVNAGLGLTMGSDNIYIGSFGVAAEGVTIRIGRSTLHTKAFITGITGVNVGGSAVYVKETLNKAFQ